MLDWFRRKQEPNLRLKPVQIGDGNLTVDLPHTFTVEQQEDRTTMAYDPAFDGAVVRFSSLHLSDPKQPDSHGLGVEFVDRRARERHKRLKESAGTHWFSYHEPSRGGGDAGDIHYWIAGLDNSVVVASCWIRRAQKHQPGARAALSAMEPAIRSLRQSRVQCSKAEGAEKCDIGALSSQHEERLMQWRQAAHRAARSMLSSDAFLRHEGDLQAIQSLLDRSGPHRSDPLTLEGLGVILGDVLARKLDLHWVTLTDSAGSTPALRYRESSIILFPTDMIVKRVERGEAVDVVDLFNTIVQHVRQMIASGKYSA